MENHNQNNYTGMSYEYSLESMSPSSLFQPTSYPTASPTMNLQYVPRRRHSGGIRKASPEALIPLDAPTQSRRYVTPSATSRKEIPAFFQKMRTNTPPSDDEEDELTEEPPASNATDQEKIEWKRRQNTLAARRSRKRKMMNMQRLEETVERLTREREIWKTRALTLKQLLISHGIICPEFRGFDISFDLGTERKGFQNPGCSLENANFGHLNAAAFERHTLTNPPPMGAPRKPLNTGLPPPVASLMPLNTPMSLAADIRFDWANFPRIHVKPGLPL